MNVKKFMVMGAVVLAVLNSAWLVEGADNNCAAVERLAMRAAAADKPAKNNAEHIGSAFAAGLMGLSNGRIAANMAAQKLPGVPSGAACVMAYWIGQAGGMKTEKPVAAISNQSTLTPLRNYGP